MLTCLRVVLVVAALVLALMLTFELTDCSLCIGRCFGLSALAWVSGAFMGWAVGFAMGLNR